MSSSILIVSERLSGLYDKWKNLSATSDDLKDPQWQKRIEKWSELSEAQRLAEIGKAKRKAEINTVIRYMHNISFFAALGRISNEPELVKFEDILDDFAKEFKQLYDFDIKATRNADISVGLSHRITEAQSGGRSLNRQDLEDLAKLKQNYFFSQMGAAYRYGNFMQMIYDNDTALTTAEKEVIKTKISAICTGDRENIEAELTALYQAFKLAEKSNIVTNSDSELFDDLQMHAFLNQFATEEEMRMATTEVLVDDKKYAELLESLDGTSSDRRIVRDVRQGKFDSEEKAELQESIAAHEAKGINFLGGLEIEGLFKIEPSQTAKESSITKRNQLRNIMVDWNARVKKLNDTKHIDGSTSYKGIPPKVEYMDKILGEIVFPEVELGLDDVALEADLEGFSTPLARQSRVIDLFIDGNLTDISRENFNRIFASFINLRIAELEKKVDKSSVETSELKNLKAFEKSHGKELSAEILNIKKRIASLSRNEALYYDLMFVEKANTKFNVEIDGIYYPGKSELENFQKIRELISKELFHEKTFDMIRATEFAIGPNELVDLLEKRKSYLENLRLAANKHGLSFNDPNTQVNLSATIRDSATGEDVNIFMPKITPGNPPQVYVSALGVEYIKMMQQVVAGLANEQGILRSQDKIETALDCKKTIRDDLVGFRKMPEGLSGFAEHRTEAAKDVTLRWSVIKKDPEGVSVVEVRLVVQNPHFAYDDEQKNTFRHGGDFASEEITKKLMKHFKEEFLDKHTADEIQQLSKTQVEVGRDGRIIGLEPTSVERKIKRDDLNNMNCNREQDLRQGVNASAIIPMQATKLNGGRDLQGSRS